jgi:hypothetical protein
MEYSNKELLNPNFKCILCGAGEHGIGVNGKYVCFDCISEITKIYNQLVKKEKKLKPLGD